MFNCQFKNCVKEATTKGLVFVMNEGDKDKPVEVYACDKHKKVTSFFEIPSDSKEKIMNKLEIVEEKGLQDVHVFQICESDAVAAYSQDEAREWYKGLTGLSDDDLYSYDEVEIVSPEYKVRKGEDEPGLITVREIVETYWNGEPFIAITTF